MRLLVGTLVLAALLGNWDRSLSSSEEGHPGPAPAAGPAPGAPPLAAWPPLLDDHERTRAEMTSKLLARVESPVDADEAKSMERFRAIVGLRKLATPEVIRWCLANFMLHIEEETDEDGVMTSYPCQQALYGMGWVTVPYLLDHMRKQDVAEQDRWRLALLLKAAMAPIVGHVLDAEAARQVVVWNQALHTQQHSARLAWYVEHLKD